jgi:hypothetical protein
MFQMDMFDPRVRLFGRTRKKKETAQKAAAARTPGTEKVRSEKHGKCGVKEN